MIVGRFHLKTHSVLFVLLAAVLAGCTQIPESCPHYEPVRLIDPETFADNDRLPFQFPLENKRSYTQPVMTNLAECGWETKDRRECHAAEDYDGVPGTPVYAFADGEISFSGTMGGYGWLIIVDHPQFNLYSLYGHLSPSRWKAVPGPVAKGELIGYLGDDFENGGTAEEPLVPHLHFAIRAGQRNDYPGAGEWRWMAGWIAVCPQDAGWLQPSVIISDQEIPENGYPMPAGGFFEIWWFLLVFGSIYTFGWVGPLVYTTKKNKPHLLLSFGVLYLVMSWVMYAKQYRMGILLFALAAGSITIGAYRLIAHRKADKESS